MKNKKSTAIPKNIPARKRHRVIKYSKTRGKKPAMPPAAFYERRSAFRGQRRGQTEQSSRSSLNPNGTEAKKMTCPFCGDGLNILRENELAYAIYDKYPVSRGHILIIPKRHVSSYFDTTPKNAGRWRLCSMNAKPFSTKHTRRTATTSASMSAKRRDRPFFTFTSTSSPATKETWTTPAAA